MIEQEIIKIDDEGNIMHIQPRVGLLPKVITSAVCIGVGLSVLNQMTRPIGFGYRVLR